MPVAAHRRAKTAASMAAAAFRRPGPAGEGLGLSASCPANSSLNQWVVQYRLFNKM
jgi:hypothetical protein